MAQTFDLNLVQGERYRLGFRYRVGGVARDLSLYSWSAKARQKESLEAELILDLNLYLALDPTDSTLLQLDIPATVLTALASKRVRPEAAWDLRMWPTGVPDDAFVLLQGAVTFDKSVT